MKNFELIKKYQNENIILTSKYKTKDNIEISNIINPYKLDFRQLCSPTDNQFKTPYCTGFAAAQLLESIYWKETGKPIQLDATQIYAKAKEIDGMLDIEGTQLEYTLKAALNLCSNLIDISKYDVKTFYSSRTKEDIEKVKYLIHKHLFILGGFKITKSWHKISYLRPIINRDDSFIGNHAVLICGYDKENFIFQNTWGIDWGRKGFAKITNSIFLKQFICGSYLDYQYPVESSS